MALSWEATRGCGCRILIGMAIKLNIQKSLARGSSRGFALLIAVIFVSVVLALGLSLGSLGYKQQILASGGIQSQYAFYAADAALECALRDAQKSPIDDPFSFENHGSTLKPACGGYIHLGSNFTELCYDSPACPNERIT